MSIKKTRIKIESVLLLCIGMLLFQGFFGQDRIGSRRDDVMEQQRENTSKKEQTGIGENKDEQVSLLVVEYATGSNRLVNKEVTGISIPTPTVPPTPVPTEAALPTPTPVRENVLSVAELAGKKYVLEELQDLTYLKENLYIVNASTKMTKIEFDVEYFIEKDLSLKQSEEPQILIFHTHGSEGFVDSRAGKTEDTVVGAGEVLAGILREKYGYNVIHDMTLFDRKNGRDNRNYAYNDALEYLEAFLEEHPSIEVVIDLHRDAGTKRVVTLNGKQTAKVMLFNGLCRNTQGKLAYLPNENLKDNLAFSFQMKLIGDEMYPGLMNRIFLKDYRYNMHLKERYLLVELGTEQNTVEEAKNAMEPLADVLAQVLGGR